MAKEKNELLDLVKIVIVAIAVSLIIRTFLYSPIIVEGPSMLPTLEDRDQMIVNKISYRFHQPERFDIVIFHAVAKKDFIKRVIGLQGEYVEVKDSKLYINGELIEEPYLNDENSANQMDFNTKNLQQTNPDGTIPEGFILVLGDNRNNSSDSREFGLVKIDDVVGKASIIYWPFSRIEKISR